MVLGDPEAIEKLPDRSMVLVQPFLQTARSQRVLAGATVDEQPEHPIVPAIVIPQALVGPLQAVPRVMSAGAAALQAPPQLIVPEFVDPQLFAAEVQEPPITSLAGAAALQAPPQLIVPEFVDPQLFAAEVQESPELATQSTVISMKASAV